ncbi:MAG: hypothetical protein CMJ58_04230 [Planctomycetaceae bacterium]|nr:hypothetical protein [Planctomycetaceae bacterium]
MNPSLAAMAAALSRQWRLRRPGKMPAGGIRTQSRSAPKLLRLRGPGRETPGSVFAALSFWHVELCPQSERTEMYDGNETIRPARLDAASSPSAYLVFPSEAAREALAQQCAGQGIRPVLLGSLGEFRTLLDAAAVAHPSCVVSAMEFPDGNGLELLQPATALSTLFTIVYRGERIDVATAVAAMQCGAFSVEAYGENASWDAAVIHAAIRFDAARHRKAERARVLKDKWDSLTPREYTILRELLTGALNKTIARRLGVSIRTVENNRARLTAKFKVKSAAQLAVAATELKLLLRELGLSELGAPRGSLEDFPPRGRARSVQANGARRPEFAD